MKKFITFNENNEIQLIHNMPFDDVNGFGKSEEELLKIGALVDDIPTTDNIPSDKLAIFKYRKEDNSVYYELIDRPLTEEEKTVKKIQELENENRELKEKISSTQDVVNEILFNAMKEGE